MNARLKTPLAIIVTALLLLAPAIANGFPLLFYDTMHYYAGGQKLVSLLTDALPGPAADAPAIHDAAAPQAPAPAAQVSPSDRESGRGLMSYMGGRSPYYSAPLYILTQLFTAWAPAFLQALLGAWLIYLSCKAFGLGLRAFIAIGIGAAALTALPWMASFLMPDVFGGYAILAAGLLLFARDAFSTWEKRLLLLLLIAAAAFHTINLLLMIAALPLAALILLLQKQRPPVIARALAPLAVAIPIAIAATLIYPAAAKIALGKPLPQPPFLMARMLADGPGRTYLYEACAKGERYTLCDFQHLPLNHADTILWSTDPKSGVYRASSWETQLKLVAEQPRFVIGVVTHEFIPQVKASWWNWRMQLRSFGVNGLPTDAAGWREAADAGALAEPFHPFLHTPVGQNLWTLGLLTRLHTIAFVAALALIAFGWTQRTIRESDAGHLFVTLILFVLTLIVLNAGIAGALSGPFPRYQARVVWLMPLLAALAASRFVVQAQAAPKASAPAG